jgi:hypothetical protein
MRKEEICSQELELDLMQIGCEVVFVGFHEDEDEDENDKEDENDEEGKNRPSLQYYDAERGMISLGRIGEVLHLIPWRKQSATEEQLLKQSPLEKNVVLLLQLVSSVKKNNVANRDLATFISKSFSNDQEETLTSSHDQKTRWIQRMLSRRSSLSKNNQPKIQCFPLDLTTKYYSTRVDVVTVTIELSQRFGIQEFLKDNLFPILKKPQVVIVFLDSYTGGKTNNKSNFFL